MKKGIVLWRSRMLYRIHVRNTKRCIYFANLSDSIRAACHVAYRRNQDMSYDNCLGWSVSSDRSGLIVLKALLYVVGCLYLISEAIRDKMLYSRFWNDHYDMLVHKKAIPEKVA